MRKKTFFRFCIGMPVMLLASAAMADGSGQWLSGQEAYSKVCGFCHDRGIGPVIKDLGKTQARGKLVGIGQRCRH